MNFGTAGPLAACVLSGLGTGVALFQAHSPVGKIARGGGPPPLAFQINSLCVDRIPESMAGPYPIYKFLIGRPKSAGSVSEAPGEERAPGWLLDRVDHAISLHREAGHSPFGSLLPGAELSERKAAVDSWAADQGHFAPNSKASLANARRGLELVETAWRDEPDPDLRRSWAALWFPLLANSLAVGTVEFFQGGPEALALWPRLNAWRRQLLREGDPFLVSLVASRSHAPGAWHEAKRNAARTYMRLRALYPDEHTLLRHLWWQALQVERDIRSPSPAVGLYSPIFEYGRELDAMREAALYTLWANRWPLHLREVFRARPLEPDLAPSPPARYWPNFKT